MKKLLFIYNPNAGRQRVRTHLAAILDVFASQDYLITAFPTQKRGDATEAAASMGPDYDRVVCCGGDGTLNETATGLMRLPDEHRPVLGYIPTGSTNDFARNLSLPRDIAGMARVAGDGVVHRCDLGSCDGRWFTYVAAFGLFTDVSYATSQTAKNLLGHLAYVLEGAGKLANIKSYHVKVEHNGLVDEGDYAYGMVGNTVSVGGLLNLPSSVVHLDDGVFEVLLVKTPNNPFEMSEIARILANPSLNLEPGGPVIGFPASDLTFSSPDPVPWTLDGEFGGERTVTRIEHTPRVLRLACGK